MEVEIDHGRIVPSEPEKLPQNGKGYLTILDSGVSTSEVNFIARSEARPIGLAKGELKVPHDFNAPLPDEIVNAFEGK